MDPRIDKLAAVLVNYSARVENGNLVRIAGSHVALPLIEALVEHVVKAGAFRSCGSVRIRTPRRSCDSPATSN